MPTEDEMIQKRGWCITYATEIAALGKKRSVSVKKIIKDAKLIAEYVFDQKKAPVTLITKKADAEKKDG